MSYISQRKEVTEMSLRPEDFPDSYLAKAKKRQAFNRQLQPIIEQFKVSMREMRWQEITWNVSGSNYYPILPAGPAAILDEAFALAASSGDQNAVENIINSECGSWYTPNRRGSIHMEIDGGGRSHFPGGGIPKSLRGIGLGYKLYRALLEKKGWLRSNTAGTLEKDNAWASLISPKLDAQGNPTEDDVHAILGPDCVFAMIKTLSTSDKVRYAKKFIEDNISINSINSRNFAIDDELKEILPADFIARLDPAERERVQREEQERQEAARRAAAEQYAETRGIVWDEQPQIGDLVYVRSYALQQMGNIPLRVIAGRLDNYVYAINLVDYVEWLQLGEQPRQLANYDNRTAEADEAGMRSFFVKVEPSQIPGLEDMSAPLFSQIPAGSRAVIKEFLLNLVDPEAVARMREEREREEAERQSRRASDAARFGEPFENHGDDEYKEALETRMPGGSFIARSIKRGSHDKIALSPAQIQRFNSRKSTEVFAPIGSNYYNTITGFEVASPITGLGFQEFRLSRFTSKTNVSPGEMLYIANHNTYYGIIAQVSYYVRNSTRNEEYVYLMVFDNTSRRARKIAVKVSALRKLERI